MGFLIILLAISVLSTSTCQADVESVVLVKSINDENFIIQRHNGETWLLEAKTYCFWTWLKEGTVILANFGYATTILINPDDGQTCECYTEEQLD